MLVNRKETTVIQDGFTKALIEPGRYERRIAQQAEGKSYEAERAIELQFADGKKRSFLVVGGSIATTSREPENDENAVEA